MTTPTSISSSSCLALALAACASSVTPGPHPTLTVSPANVCRTTSVNIQATGAGALTVTASPQTSPPLSERFTGPVHILADNTSVTVTDTFNGSSASTSRTVRVYPGSVSLGGTARCAGRVWAVSQTLSAVDWAPEIHVDTVNNNSMSVLQVQAPNGTFVSVPPWDSFSVGDQPITGSWSFLRLLAPGETCEGTTPLGAIVQAHCS